MRLVYVSDLHGRTEHYEAAFRLAAERRAGALVLGGDLVPVVKTVHAQLEWIAAWLRPRLSAHHARGGCPVLLIPGNHEYVSTERAYGELAAEGLCINLHGRCCALGEWDFVGFGLALPSPWYVKDHERRDLPGSRPPQVCRKPTADLGRGEWEVVDEAGWFLGHPTLQEELAALPEPRDWRRTVLVCHQPPLGSGLDVLLSGEPIGSEAVRRYILTRRPALALHGHIHEAPRVSGRCGWPAGESLCINAGQDLGGTCAAVFDLKDPASTWWHSQGLPLLP